MRARTHVPVVAAAAVLPLRKMCANTHPILSHAIPFNPSGELSHTLLPCLV